MRKRIINRYNAFYQRYINIDIDELILNIQNILPMFDNFVLEQGGYKLKIAKIF